MRAAPQLSLLRHPLCGQLVTQEQVTVASQSQSETNLNEVEQSFYRGGSNDKETLERTNNSLAGTWFPQRTIHPNVFGNEARNARSHIIYIEYYPLWLVMLAVAASLSLLLSSSLLLIMWRYILTHMKTCAKLQQTAQPLLTNVWLTLTMLGTLSTHLPTPIFDQVPTSVLLLHWSSLLKV